jgi:hypothetical protein
VRACVCVHQVRSDVTQAKIIGVNCLGTRVNLAFQKIRFVGFHGASLIYLILSYLSILSIYLIYLSISIAVSALLPSLLYDA